MIDKNKGQEPKSKKYRGKETQIKSQGPNPEAKTSIKDGFSDLEGYIFGLGPIASDFFARTMKEMGRYLGKTYSDICQPSIMNRIPATFPDPEMSIIIPDTGVERLKNDMDMTYLKKNTIDEAIR